MTIETQSVFRKRHHAIAFTCVTESIDYWIVYVSEPVTDSPKTLETTRKQTGYTVRRFGKCAAFGNYMYIMGEAA